MLCQKHGGEVFDVLLMKDDIAEMKAALADLVAQVPLGSRFQDQIKLKSPPIHGSYL